MRTVRYAQSAEAAFQTLLAQGAEKFGFDIADEKRRLLHTCVRSYLAEQPHHL
jgi:plasmid stabilization system protein ParE